MIPDASSLAGLPIIVSVLLIMGGLLVYTIKSNSETQKEKGLAFLDDNKRKDEVLATLTIRAFDSMDKNTEVLQKLIGAIQVNTDATKAVSKTLEDMRLEIATTGGRRITDK